MSPILDGDIMSLKDDVIFRIMCDACKWVHANVKEPALWYGPICEDATWRSILFVYDDQLREYGTEAKLFLRMALTSIVTKMMIST